MDRVHARMAARAKMPTGFVSQPEPRTIGRYARGRQLVAGNFLFSGHLIEAPGRTIWDIVAEAPHIAAEVQGCTWLDDLAAVGDAKARERAQAWVFEWIDRFGQGRGPGWTPDLTGRRLIRWINHGFFLLRGQDKAAADKFFLSLARQTLFLSRRWRSARPGLPRFEALTGLIYAGLSLEGMEAHVDPAIAELTRVCERQVSEGGGISTRNPEDLLEVLTLLNWAVQAQSEAGRSPPAPQLAAIVRITPTLRTLRHADGGLARFHGGGRGIDGWLDHALATAATPGMRREDLAMGFARLAAGRTSVIVDAAPPPMGPASVDAHASTNAFELTSGRRPMIVNCGSGRSFGPDWRRAGRATPSHSTLGLAGISSSRLGALDGHDGRKADELVEVPDRVPAIFSRLPDGRRLEVAHNGYQRTHGLTHARTLDLSFDGRALAGEDLLTTLSDGDKARFDRAMDAARLDGIAFAVRFHLHPEVDASIDLGGAAVSLALKSGEVWIFRQDGSATMTLEPSVYLEIGRLRPRNAQQVVLSGHAMSYATRVRWYLAKAQDTPDGLRDLGQHDSDMLADDA